MSLLFILLIFSPFMGALGLVILGKIFDINLLLEMPPLKSVQWSVLISTCIWSNGGFDYVGALAGEVKGGQRTFMIGLLCAFPLVFVNYMIPIVICYMPNPDFALWQPGYFTVVAYKMNVWLGRWMAFGSAVSNFGQFSAGLAPTARIVWAMARGSDGSPRFLPKFLAWSWVRHTGTVRPVAAIIFCGLACVFISLLPFQFLVNLFLVLRLTNLFSEYAALIYQRYKLPDHPRPWRVPGGALGPWLLVIPSIFIATLAMVTNSAIVLIVGGSATAVIFILGGIYGVYIYYFMNEDDRSKYLTARNETAAKEDVTKEANRSVN